jgi:hypothetical protein
LRAPAFAFSEAVITVPQYALPQGATRTTTLPFWFFHCPSSAACAEAPTGTVAASAMSTIFVRIRFMFMLLGKLCGKNRAKTLPLDER